MFVLVHGLHGHSNDMAYVSQCITERLGSSEVVLLNATCNEGQTSDGIDNGGARLAQQIRSTVEAHPSLQTIAFVCYSLGGLYVRYALALLQEQGSDGSTPVQRGHGYVLGLCARLYVSLASPHLGSRQQCQVFGRRFTEFVGKKFLGRTGEQVLLLDGRHQDCQEGTDAQAPAPGCACRGAHGCECALGTDRHNPLPLLLRMAEDDHFITPLRKFAHLHCYANIWNDIGVHYCSAAMRRENRFLRAPPKPSGNPWRATVLPDEADEPDIPATHDPITPGTPVTVTPLSPKTASFLASADEITSETSTSGSPLSTSMSGSPLSPKTVFIAPADVVTPDTAISLTPLSEETVVQRMRSSLIRLPWTRWAVVGRPLLAHTDIVVKFPIINRYGRSVIQHVMDHPFADAYPEHRAQSAISAEGKGQTLQEHHSTSYGQTGKPLERSAPDFTKAGEEDRTHGADGGCAPPTTTAF